MTDGTTEPIPPRQITQSLEEAHAALVYKTNEFKGALRIAGKYGIPGDLLKRAMLERYRDLKGEAREERNRPGMSADERRAAEAKIDDSAFKALQQELQGYVDDYNAGEFPVANLDGFRRFRNQVWENYHDDFRRQFDTYCELAGKIFDQCKAGSWNDHQERNVSNFFENNNLFRRWDASAKMNELKTKKEYAPYRLVIPALLGSLAQKVKRWQAENPLERAVCWQAGRQLDGMLLAKRRTGVFDEQQRLKAPDYDADSCRYLNQAAIDKMLNERTDYYVNYKEAKQMIKAAFEEHGLTGKIAGGYLYSLDYLLEDMDKIFGPLENAKLRIPKHLLTARADAVDAMNANIMPGERNPLEDYISKLPRAGEETADLPVLREGLYQQPDVAAFELIRQLLKQSLFERRPENIQNLANNAEKLCESYKKRRTPPAPQLPPHSQGWIDTHPDKMAYAAAAMFGGLGVGAMLAGKYPWSRQDYKVEEERAQREKEEGKKEPKISFAQVQGVALLLTALLLGWNAYKHKGSAVTSLLGRLRQAFPPGRNA